MMEIKASKFLPGVIAVGIYFFVLGLLVFYFNHRNEEPSKKYVKKNEQRIQVALSGGPNSEKKRTKKNALSTPKKKAQVKSNPKKFAQKKVIKEKIVKKKKLNKKVIKKPKKKNNTKDLFANVKTPKKKNIIQVSDKPLKTKPKSNLIKVSNNKTSASQRINDSLKNQKSSDSGVESAYLARVQSMLEDWPAQNEYAGEKIKVELYIYPSGYFDFKIKSASRNNNFNTGLREYLEQLQEYGFGRHKGKRTYHFEAEFIAKE